MFLSLIHYEIVNNKPKHCDETSTISTQQPIPGSDISYSIRHVEESWHHLIKSDDSKKLKEIAVCNFDFLLAAVSYNSIFFCAALLIKILLNCQNFESKFFEIYNFKFFKICNFRVF